jgi:hypothetical protein
MNEQIQKEQKFQGFDQQATPQRPDTAPRKEDYIDFEEVK